MRPVAEADGHDVPGLVDELCPSLRIISKRLLSAVRSDDTVARVGGDEFLVLLDPVASESDATAAARRIIGAFEQSMQIAGQRAEVGVSIGIAFGRIDGDSFDDLCRRADIAMYVAKASGRNTYCLHRPEMSRLSATPAEPRTCDEAVDAPAAGVSSQVA